MKKSKSVFDTLVQIRAELLVSVNETHTGWKTELNAAMWAKIGNDEESGLTLISTPSTVNVPVRNEGVYRITYTFGDITLYPPDDQAIQLKKGDSLTIGKSSNEKT